MKAVILAAGRGSRIGQMTDDKPKCLLELGGRALLDWQIGALSAGGAQEIITVTGYQARSIEARGHKTVHNDRWQSSNMVTSLLCATIDSDSPVIVSYGDIVFGADAVSRMVAAPGSLVVAYDINWRTLWERRFENPLIDAESFEIDSKGRIREIGGPITRMSEAAGQFVGLLKFTPESLRWVRSLVSENSSHPDDLDMTKLLSLLIERGHVIRGLGISGGWCEIDTSTDLDVANELLEEGLLPLPIPTL